MNRRRPTQARSRRWIALWTAGALSTAGASWTFLAADETTILRLPPSTPLTASPAASSGPVASKSNSANDITAASPAGANARNAFPVADRLPNGASSPTATAGTATAGTATAETTETEMPATELVVEDGSDNESPPAISLPQAIRSPAVRPQAERTQPERIQAERTQPERTQADAVEQSSAASRSVIRALSPTRLPPAANAPANAPANSPSRLPPTAGSRTQPASVAPVRLPPVEPSGSPAYGAFERPPVSIGREPPPGPGNGLSSSGLSSNGWSSNGLSSNGVPRNGSPATGTSRPRAGTGQAAAPDRLPPGNAVNGVSNAAPSVSPPNAETASTDWVSSRWHRFKTGAQRDYWGYPEHFCERPFGVPNQVAYQAMVDNARNDLLVFHQYDFHDGKEESAAGLNAAGLRRVDRVAALLAKQAGGSIVVVELVPDQPQLTEARREEVAAQLGRYGFHEPAIRVGVGRARRGLTGREAEGIQRTYDRMTGASGLGGAMNGMNSAFGSGTMGGASMSGNGMNAIQGSSTMGGGNGFPVTPGY